MKKFAILLSLLVSSVAFGRMNTADMSCAEARALVKEKGAIVLSHGDQSLYTRFVSSARYCQTGESTQTAFAISGDEDKCRVGYVCADRDSSGSYTAPSEYHVCREGSRQIFTEHDSTNDRSYQVVRTCTNGRWYPKAPPVTPIQCKEGRTQIFWENSSNSDHQVQVIKVCRSGKWINRK